MDEKKYIEYKYSDKVVEISDVLPLEGVNQNAFFDMIAEARKTAMKENIKANSIILNEKFAKVNPHLFNFCGAVFELPAMICGLECSYTSDELPDDFAFAILERRKTEREHLVQETAKNVLEGYICKLVNARLVGVNDDLYYELLEAKEDLLNEKYGTTT